MTGMGVSVSHDLDEVIPRMDVIDMLRVQQERMAIFLLDKVFFLLLML